MGKDSLVHDTVSADCPPDASGNVKVIRVPVTRYYPRVDTFFDHKILRVENTAQVEALKITLGKEHDARIKAESQRDQSYWISGIAGAVILILLLFIFIKR